MHVDETRSVAWLIYNTAADCELAKAFLDGVLTPSGRAMMTFAYPDAHGHRAFHLKIRNIDPDIAEGFFGQVLVEAGGLQPPHRIKLREPTSLVKTPLPGKIDRL
jgi:hypothetical protein